MRVLIFVMFQIWYHVKHYLYNFSEMEKLDDHQDALLHVIECHHLMLAAVHGTGVMSEPTYQLIKAQVTNWKGNELLLNWLRVGDCKESVQERLNIFMVVLRREVEGQGHVANLIDGFCGK